jgi:hypothetical protein
MGSKQSAQSGQEGHMPESKPKSEVSSLPVPFSVNPDKYPCNGTNLNRVPTSFQSIVADDPVISRRKFDRTGPNPDPTYCYLRRTMACQNFRSQ